MLSNSAASIIPIGCSASGILLIFALVTFIGECLDRMEQRRNATTSVYVADTAAASVFIDVIASVHVDDAAPPAASVVIDVERLQKLQDIGSVAAAEDESDPCVICYEEFKAKERLRVMPQCAHGFHIDCIDTWLLSHSSCPTCRGQVLEKGFWEP